MQTDNNIVFIGPNSSAIHSMGDKIESKRIGQRAGVNLIPGFDGEVPDEDTAVKIANDIGKRFSVRKYSWEIPSVYLC